MHSTSLSFECTAIVWEMQEGIAITNNYANIWPCGVEGVKNWPGRRNRLPHPVCKPLDSKEGGADGWVSSAGPPASQFLTASQRGDGLASKPVPSLTLGAMWKSSRHAVKAMDSSTFAC